METANTQFQKSKTGCSFCGSHNLYMSLDFFYRFYSILRALTEVKPRLRDGSLSWRRIGQNMDTPRYGHGTFLDEWRHIPGTRDLCLLRHGTTQENEDGITIGSTDPPLSIGGRSELLAIQPYVLQPDVVCSSDLKRASETARILFPGLRILYLPLLRERSFGVLEGRAYDSSKLKAFEQLDDGELLGKYGIEPISSVTKRAHEVLGIVRNISAYRIMLVGHGAFFRSMMSILLPDDPRPTLHNGCYHRIILNGKGDLVHCSLNQTWQRAESSVARHLPSSRLD